MGKKTSIRAGWVTWLGFIAVACATIAVLLLFLNIQQRKAEELQYPLKLVAIERDQIDPSLWGQNFPYEYDSFMKTGLDYGKTEYGGSTPYSKLERYPAMKRLWAGYAFSVDHNEERGHYYAAQDQASTKRVKITSQPGACANCHAAEAPLLIQKMGWDNFNHTPYDSLKPHLRTGSSCSDCHDPETMELRITRPAFLYAMEEEGVDLSKATRQEMRTYVCAQCHVEYYFKGENKVLTFPWSRGRTIDAIEEHYDTYGFSDWTHWETEASMIKIQHPEFELWETGIHARSGVSCADCHMPYVRIGSVKISDHWTRSPLTSINQSCQTCHHWPEEELRGRVLEIQNRTAHLLRKTEEATVSAINVITEIRKAGASKEDLKEALHFQRRAQIRWDFISSENSTGFHSSQEAARILAEAIDYARQAEISARKAVMRK